MSNMSYCRFQNTAYDLSDCVNNLRSLDPNDAHPNTNNERRARAEIIRNAAELIRELQIEDIYDELEINRAIELLNSEYE